jgi:fumarylacetoacetate (FAA) hydrolase
MKFATLDDGTRDGSLLLVSRDLSRAVSAAPIAATLIDALERWEAVEGDLRSRYDALCAGEIEDAFDLDARSLMACLPRTYQFVDGSAYLNHIELVRKARGAEMPASFLTDPLAYQGVSDHFLAAHDDIAHATTDWGIDFEAEVGILTSDVPYRTKAADAEQYIRLLLLINDVSLRALIPAELAKGFGFLVSKPPSALSAFAVTPDELGDAWSGGKIHLPMDVHWNGEWYGSPEAGDAMHFSFHELVEHVSQTRPLRAGTLIGSGTISNPDRTKGSCCIAEQRMIEKIETGAFKTPFMQFGDTVRIEMKQDGAAVFGVIEQKVISFEA